MLCPRLPLTVLTGFLGLARRRPSRAIQTFADTAVVVNELGKVKLDHELPASAEGGRGCATILILSEIEGEVEALKR